MNGESTGRGWADFAGVMFTLGGLFNLVAGVSALVSKGYFVPSGLIYGTLRFWGWVWIVLAIVQFIVSYLLFAKRPSGRVWGIALAVISALVWMFLLSFTPYWATTILVVDVLIIYGLAAHEEAFVSGPPHPVT